MKLKIFEIKWAEPKIIDDKSTRILVVRRKELKDAVAWAESLGKVDYVKQIGVE